MQIRVNQSIVISASILLAGAQARAQVVHSWTTPTANARIGSAVAIDEGVALVGARREPAGGVVESGVVHMFRSTGHGAPWVEDSAALLPPSPEAGGHFGAAVAVHGDLAVVGAPYRDSLSTFDEGAAYVFEITPSGAVFQDRLLPYHLMDPGDQFGAAVDVHGDYVVVGSPGDDEDATDAGRVTVYRRPSSGPTWGAPEGIMPPPSPQAGDALGFSVAIEGDVLAVGAPFHAEGGFASGVVYLYLRNSSSPATWEYVATLQPSMPVDDSHFGYSLDLRDGHLIVGAPGIEAAFVYRRLPTGVWAFQGRLDGVGCADAQFGTAVAIDTPRALVGAPGESAAVAFHRTGPATWIDGERFQVKPFSSNYGASVAMSGERLLIGAPYFDGAATDAGRVDFVGNPAFARGYGYGACGACPCGNDDPYAGCRNSTGSGAVLRVEGSASLAADDLVLRASHMQPGVVSRILMGGGMMWGALGSGRRAVAVGSSGNVGFTRLPSSPTDSLGEHVLGPAISTISPTYASFAMMGGTWNFQCWYRDPTTPCGPSKGTNFSNAVSVTFGP
jgi:hypothetical protein